MRPEPFKKWTRPLRLRRHLSQYLAPGQSGLIHLGIVAGADPWQIVEMRRRSRGWVLSLAPRDVIAEDKVHYIYRSFLQVVVYLIARTNSSVTSAFAELSDGSSMPSDRIVFCADYPDAMLVPDPIFFNSAGYWLQREKLSAQRPWQERDDRIVWRGATSGPGRLPDESLDLAAPDLRQRIRLCGVLRSTPGVDARIYRAVQTPDPEAMSERLARAGILAGPVPEESWLDRKFALDIDGNTNAWSNLFLRLLFGCCVIKVQSPRGFKQWYYDRLVPWRHYVPVRADLADLVERIDWCRQSPAHCRDIAMAGQALALSMTFENETCWGIERINNRLGSAGSAVTANS